MALSPTHFERVLADWAKYCLGVSNTERSLDAVAMNGKTLCDTLQPHERAVHLLALLDQHTGCVLSQSRVDAKTNEHKGALELLKTLVLEGRVITDDAIFCQRDVCQEIRDGGGHYFFVVKDNQPALKESLAAEFRAAQDHHKLAPYDRTAAPVAS